MRISPARDKMQRDELTQLASGHRNSVGTGHVTRYAAGGTEAWQDSKSCARRVSFRLSKAALPRIPAAHFSVRRVLLLEAQSGQDGMRLVPEQEAALLLRELHAAPLKFFKHAYCNFLKFSKRDQTHTFAEPKRMNELKFVAHTPSAASSWGSAGPPKVVSSIPPLWTRAVINPPIAATY